MRPAYQLAALAAAALTFAFSQAGAQSVCAPAAPAPTIAASYDDAIMDRRVTLHGREISLRDALDRLSAAASVRLSYSSQLLELSRPVCLEYESVPVGRVLQNLLAGLDVHPVVVGSNLIVLTPGLSGSADATTDAPLVTSIGMLDRVVVTGSTIGASQRALPIALDVISGKQLSERGATSLSGALDGAVPGLWLWEQSPLSLLARYGSIRGASSFGVSYPKVYVDGIEVANSLLVTRLDPESISRIEVIRGPQGAALYGADAISGVLNIVTRQESPQAGQPHAQIRTQGGASSSEYSTGNVLSQNHALSLNTGSNVKSARLGMTLSTIGPFIPGASSQQVTANGGLRFVRSRGVITGTFRVFAQDARTPSSPLLAGIDAWSATAAAARLAGLDYPDRSAAPPGSPMDSARMRRLDSLSRLVVLDSSDRQTVRQFTLGANATLAQNDRWTHSFVTGLDGYRLRSASVLDGAFPSALDSALRAATGNAIRTTLRASSVGKFGDLATKAATVTLAAEHTYVRDETETLDLFSPPSGDSPPDYVEDRRRLTESRNNAGVIGQLTASLRETFFVSGGLRVER
ncbi:MAG: TonB-dependent receptor plug domain-containing protein, partial [Gemmatimonadaceae bacterium]